MLSLSVTCCYHQCMSYKLFLQGYTAEEVKKMDKPTQEELLRERIRKQGESEKVLNMLRSIKAWNEELDNMQADLWAKATKRRR